MSEKETTKIIGGLKLGCVFLLEHSSIRTMESSELSLCSKFDTISYKLFILFSTLSGSSNHHPLLIQDNQADFNNQPLFDF